ncbi:hypothetical protein COOONC_12257, partial [Cooperia oncophora]
MTSKGQSEEIHADTFNFVVIVCRVGTEDGERCKTEELLKKYPLDVFPNWTINEGERYYVCAPIDSLGEWAFHLRSHLTALILSGNPAIGFLQ